MASSLFGEGASASSNIFTTFGKSSGRGASGLNGSRGASGISGSGAGISKVKSDSMGNGSSGVNQSDSEQTAASDAARNGLSTTATSGQSHGTGSSGAKTGTATDGTATSEQNSRSHSVAASSAVAGQGGISSGGGGKGGKGGVSSASLNASGERTQSNDVTEAAKHDKGGSKATSATEAATLGTSSQTASSGLMAEKGTAPSLGMSGVLSASKGTSAGASVPTDTAAAGLFNDNAFVSSGGNFTQSTYHSDMGMAPMDAVGSTNSFRSDVLERTLGSFADEFVQSGNGISDTQSGVPAGLLNVGGSSFSAYPQIQSYSQSSTDENGVTQTQTYERQVGEDGSVQDSYKESVRQTIEGENGETITREFSTVTDSSGATMGHASQTTVDSAGNVTSTGLTAPVATHSYGLGEVGPDVSHSLQSPVPVDTVLNINAPLTDGPSFVTGADSSIAEKLDSAFNANLEADELREVVQDIVSQALANYPEHTNVGVMVQLPESMLQENDNRVVAVMEGIELGGGVPVHVVGRDNATGGYLLEGTPTLDFMEHQRGHETSLILSTEAEKMGQDIPRGVTRQIGDLINSGAVDDHKVVLINNDGSIQASDPQFLAKGEAEQHMTVGEIKGLSQEMASITPQHVTNLDHMFASSETSHSLADYASLAGAASLVEMAEQGHGLESKLEGLQQAVAEAGAAQGVDVKIDGYEAAQILQAGSDLARENIEVLDVAKVVVAENGEVSITASEAEIPEKAVAIPLDEALEAAGISREELGNREQEQANVQALVQEEKEIEAEAEAELAMAE